MAREKRFDNGRERGFGQEMILGVMEGKWRLGGMHDTHGNFVFFFFIRRL
jgi:hypothetical protein